jgi:hypothetical protein
VAGGAKTRRVGPLTVTETATAEDLGQPSDANRFRAFNEPFQWCFGPESGPSQGITVINASANATGKVRSEYQ